MQIRVTLELRRCCLQIQKADRVVVMTGAGISTSIGIPDFRCDTATYMCAQRLYSDRLKPSATFTIDT
jgi:NAD-dependent SIR2 family protein deacetylase